MKDPRSYTRPFIDFTTKLTADEIDFYTDASGSAKLGYGCFFNGHWCSGFWGEELITSCSPSIEFLELFAVTVGIVLWAEALQNQRVVIFCDNKSVVEMINKTVSGCDKCMKLIRIITFMSLKHNVRFFAKYVKSADNILGDVLSRNSFSHFWKHAPKNADLFGTLTPEELLPLNKFWS